MEEQNVDEFTEAVKDYDSISRLDQWYTTILLRIKKQVDDNPDLRWITEKPKPHLLPLFKIIYNIENAEESILFSQYLATIFISFSGLWTVRGVS